MRTARAMRFLVLFCAFVPLAAYAAPAAVDGVMTLTDQDLGSGVPLNGQWEFAWGSLVSPQDAFSSRSGVSWQTVSVPGSWT
ncbi:MAG TPA: hypothetical protein VL359_20880, partial [bacterium]|nr:hypothetical protein [bacterium]